jgi:hypothetical protein
VVINKREPAFTVRKYTQPFVFIGAKPQYVGWLFCAYGE